MRNIYLHISPNTALQLQVRPNIRQHLLSCSEALTTSLELHPGGLTLQCHTGQTAVLRALTLGLLGSNEYSTTDNVENR